jgi:hypothetical protein
VKVIGIIRPIETRELEVEADTYQDAFELIQSQVPEGWQLLQVKQV